MKNLLPVSYRKKILTKLMLSGFDDKHLNNYSDEEVSALLDHFWENRENLRIDTMPLFSLLRGYRLQLDNETQFVYFEVDTKKISKRNLHRLRQMFNWKRKNGI